MAPPPAVWTARRRVVLGPVLIVAAGLLWSCELKQLLSPDPPPRLVLSPELLLDTAALGSSGSRLHTLRVTTDGMGGIAWDASVTGGSSWLSLAPPSDTAPTEVVVVFKPPGLVMGSYEDTIAFSSVDRPGDKVLVPVRLTIATANAARLRFTVQPNSVAAGAAITPAVRVAAVDALGNVATGFTGSIGVAIGSNPGNGTLSGTITVATVNGVATFPSLSIDRSGNGYTLVAFTSGGSIAGATSTPFAVAAGAASRVGFSTQPVDSRKNRSITPAVRIAVRDAFGNTAEKFSGDVSMSLSTDGSVLKNARLSGTTPVKAVNGVATFTNLKIDQLGTGYTLSASSPGLVAAVSSGFKVTP